MGLIAFILAASVALAVGYEADAPPVLVEFFCDIDPASCRWDMTYEIPETYNDLKDTGIMNLYINLYGKTEEPFGPDEFYEQRLSECVIHYNNDNDTLIEFFKCFMSIDHFPEAAVDGKQCAEKLSLDWSVLEDCYQSDEGKKLLIKAGEKFHNMHPPVSYYPEYWIDHHPRVQAYGKLKEYVCSAYTGTLPDTCKDTVRG